MRSNQRHPIRRRAFLKAAAGVSAAAAVCPWARGAAPAGEGPARWTMRLSGSTINFTKLPIEKAVERLAALGFEAVDVWSAHAGCPHLDDVLDRLGPVGLKELLAKHAVKLYSFSVYAGGYRKYAELLGRSGGGVAVRGSAGRCDPSELQARTKAFLDGLKPELELAEKHNSYLAVENHGGSLLNSLDSLKAFVELNRHPRLGIALAPYHLQAGKFSVEEAIGIAGKQLLYFYAWQNAPGLGQLPGHGPANLTPWLAALAKAGYAGHVNPFMHHEPEPEAMSQALAKSIAYLKGVQAKIAAG